jgi:hypothetical protein
VRGLPLSRGACKSGPTNATRATAPNYPPARAPQSSPLNPDIFHLLSIADSHSARYLKTACFDNLFVYGQHLFKDKAIEHLEPRLMVELLRDFAERRAEHMPSPPPPPPEEDPELESDEPEEDPGPMPGARRMRKRKPPPP